MKGIEEVQQVVFGSGIGAEDEGELAVRFGEPAGAPAPQSDEYGFRNFNAALICAVVNGRSAATTNTGR